MMALRRSGGTWISARGSTVRRWGLNVQQQDSAAMAGPGERDDMLDRMKRARRSVERDKNPPRRWLFRALKRKRAQTGEVLLREKVMTSGTQMPRQVYFSLR